MVGADELVARADTNSNWETMMSHELAEEILDQRLSKFEFQEIVNALDDGVFEIVMSFKK